MSERARLSIFNMLGPLEGKTVLDLFAGTGSLGLEALSRGAASCAFVENDRKALECLKQNLKNIENCKIIKNDVYKINLENKFDLVFIDQPYDKFDKNINYFSKFLKEDGIMIISSPEPIDESSRHYANCFITLVKK